MSLRSPLLRRCPCALSSFFSEKGVRLIFRVGAPSLVRRCCSVCCSGCLRNCIQSQPQLLFAAASHSSWSRSFSSLAESRELEHFNQASQEAGTTRLYRNIISPLPQICSMVQIKRVWLSCTKQNKPNRSTADPRKWGSIFALRTKHLRYKSCWHAERKKPRAENCCPLH